MESKFIPTLQVGNGYTYLKLRGVLDEDNLLANLISQIQGRLLLIDMAEMERINSCGVRDWVNWLNQIQALGLQVILLRCSPAVVAQANMVTNFSADAFIHSFYAPYVHPDTGDEQSVLLFTEDLRQVRPIKAPKIFSDDGEELEFDEFEESYFAFVNDPRMLNYHTPADINAVIQYFVPESASHQPVITSKASSSHDFPSTSVPSPANAVSAPTAGPATMQGALQSMPNASAGFGGRAPSTAGMPSAARYGTQPSGIYQNNASANASANAYGAPPRPNVPNPPQPSPSPSPLLPQPSAPVRHAQPPIPGNQAYQPLPTPEAVVRPAVQVQVQQPQVSPANAQQNTGNAQPMSPTPAVSMPQPPSSPIDQNRSPLAQSSDMRQASRAVSQKNLLIMGGLIGFGMLIVIILIIVLIMMKS